MQTQAADNTMRGAVIHGTRDIRIEQRPMPTVQEPTDVVVKTIAACVCGSDLWPYRGINPVEDPWPIGHEFLGEVVECGSDAAELFQPGQWVVGGFTYNCGACPPCRDGQTASCQNGGGYEGCQSEYIRIPHADATLVAVPEPVDPALIPHLLTLSDVMCTGWHAAVSAQVKAGDTVVIVGDGAVGLCGVIAAKQLGASRIIMMSRHADRQAQATAFGATDIVATRGQEGIDAVLALTDGRGADATLECVGTEDSLKQALGCTRAGGHVGWVGVPHIENFPYGTMFRRNITLGGGIANVRTYLPQLMDLVLQGAITPGDVFTKTVDLEHISQAYEAMDERRAIKAMVNFS